MRPRISLVVLAMTCLAMAVTRPVAAQLSASIYMSVGPAGPQIDAFRSGTAVVYTVLEYQDASQTSLLIEVSGNGGIELFAHSEVYDGSGREDIRITGVDILQGYRAAAADWADRLLEAIDKALEASSAATMRSRTEVAVARANNLDVALAALEGYEHPLDVVENLEEARDWTEQVRTAGETIVNVTQVPDEELVARLTELRGLAEEAQAATQAALDGMVMDIGRPILDGSYTTNLYRVQGNSRYLSQTVEWEVRADGTPGTPVAPTPTASPTQTPTVTPVASPTPLPTRPPATATVPGPTATARPGASATPTMSLPAVTPRATIGTTPIVLPPAATPAAPTPSAIPSELEASVTTEAYPPATRIVPISPGGGTPATPAADQARVERVATAQHRGAAAMTPTTARNALLFQTGPLPPQETTAFPVQRVGALLGAVLLGLIAVWLRTHL